MAEQPGTSEEAMSEQQDAATDEQYAADLQAVEEALRRAADASCSSLNAAYEEDGKQQPNVSAWAVLRLAADDKQQAESLAQLLEPLLRRHLRRLGIEDLAVVVPHYTGKYRMAWLVTFAWPIMSPNTYPATAEVFLDGVHVWSEDMATRFLLWLATEDGSFDSFFDHCPVSDNISMTIVVSKAEELDNAIHLSACTMMRQFNDGNIVEQLCELVETAQQHMEHLDLERLQLQPFTNYEEARMLPIRSKQELRNFVQSHAPELMDALEQRLFSRIARKQLWSQLSPPLRAYIVGLLVGDGSVSRSEVFLGLQGGDWAALMLCALMIGNLGAGLTMDLICTRTLPRLGLFRQAYDVQARLVLKGGLAAAVRACGLPVGEKAHGITDENLATIRRTTTDKFPGIYTAGHWAADGTGIRTSSQGGAGGQRLESTRWEIVGTADTLLDFLLDILRPIGVTSWSKGSQFSNGWKLHAEGANLVAAVLIDMPTIELQLYLAGGGVLEDEWRFWLKMGRDGRTIRFSPGICLIARKALKMHTYMHALNNMGSGTWLAPGMLQLPTVTMVVLPPDGLMAPMLEEFETYTDFPRHFALTMDIAGLKNRLDGGYSVVSGSALAFLSRAANNVKIKGEGRKDYLAHPVVRPAHQAMLNFPYASGILLEELEELDEELSKTFAGRHYYFQVKKLLPRLCIPVPHLRRPQPARKADDREPEALNDLLAGKPEDFKDIINVEWRMLMQETMRVKFTASDSIFGVMHRQCRLPHALAESVEPLPLDALLYGAPSATAIRDLALVLAATWDGELDLEDDNREIIPWLCELGREDGHQEPGDEEIQLQSVLASLMSLAAIINVDGKTVQLLIERPELQLVASWRLTKKSRAAGIISNKFLAMFRVHVQHNDWHLHMQQRATLPDHKPSLACEAPLWATLRNMQCRKHGASAAKPAPYDTTPQMSEVTQQYVPDYAIEPLPDRAVRREMSEPAPLGWLPDAHIDDWIEIYDPRRPNWAVGRGRFAGFTVLGTRLVTPLVVIIDRIVWYGGRAVLHRIPGLRGMRLAGPLWFLVSAHILFPVPVPGSAAAAAADALRNGLEVCIQRSQTATDHAAAAAATVISDGDDDDAALRLGGDVSGAGAAAHTAGNRAPGAGITGGDAGAAAMDVDPPAVVAAAEQCSVHLFGDGAGCRPGSAHSLMSDLGQDAEVEEPRSVADLFRAADDVMRQYADDPMDMDLTAGAGAARGPISQEMDMPLPSTAAAASAVPVGIPAPLRMSLPSRRQAPAPSDASVMGMCYGSPPPSSRRNPMSSESSAEVGVWRPPPPPGSRRNPMSSDS